MFLECPILLVGSILVDLKACPNFPYSIRDFLPLPHLDVLSPYPKRADQRSLLSLPRQNKAISRDWKFVRLEVFIIDALFEIESYLMLFMNILYDIGERIDS